jgi:cyclopropane fatty-acyl-phospholipid synthase-like methyltransferase
MPYFDAFFDLPPTGIGQRLQMNKARHVLLRLQHQSAALNRVLEIGPGWGELADLCCAAQIQHFAIEVNNLRAASLVKRGIPTVMSYTPPIPLRAGEFDAVVALNVIEHMPDLPTALRFLREMVRVARPGALICINCPDLVFSGSMFWDADYTHNFPTSMRRMIQMYRDQGLTIVDATYFAGTIAGPLATPVGWLARFLPVGLIGYLMRSAVTGDRMRRAQLTFMRNVFIIGRVPESGMRL